MNFSKLYTVPAEATVKGAKVIGKGTVKVTEPIGKGTLYVTDYIEIGTAKATEKVVAAASDFKAGVKKHNNNKGDRMIARMIARDERKVARAAKKAEKAEHDAQQQRYEEVKAAEGDDK